MFSTYSKNFSSLFFDFKSSGQGSFNYIVDWENLWVTMIPSQTWNYYSFKMVSHKSVKDCDEKNQQKPFECVQRFLASKKKFCTLPWLKKYTSGTICEKTESKEIKNYFDIYFQILNGKLDHELKNFGCLVQNCRQNTWTTKQFARNEKYQLVDTMGKYNTIMQKTTAMVTFLANTKKVKVFIYDIFRNTNSHFCGI